MEKISLITGINGQDSSYLAELLLEKDYIVWGIIRRSSVSNTSRIDHLLDNPNLIIKYGDVTDALCIVNILQEIKNKHIFDRIEIYNLAAQSHVQVSFEMPNYTANVDAVGTLNILEAIRSTGLTHIARFYQASTSELFGKVVETPQRESTPFYPRSPYACAKLYAYWITKNYRESYEMFASSGILFNHESKRRGEFFVTRKITLQLGKIVNGLTDKLILGCIDAQRDWGHAFDYARSMWMILQADKPDDWVVSTNETHSVREFVEKAFALKGFDIKWKGIGINEIGYDANTGRELIFIDEKYFRPAEVDLLLGDSTKIRNQLGWAPTMTFDDLVKEMVEHDCKINIK